MGRKGKKPEAAPLFEADEANAEKVGGSRVPCYGRLLPGLCRRCDTSERGGVYAVPQAGSFSHLRASVTWCCAVFCEQEAASSGTELPKSAMGKAFSNADKKVRDKAVAVFSKWISRQDSLKDEVRAGCYVPFLLRMHYCSRQMQTPENDTVVAGFGRITCGSGRRSSTATGCPTKGPCSRNSPSAWQV